MLHRTWQQQRPHPRLVAHAVAGPAEIQTAATRAAQKAALTLGSEVEVGGGRSFVWAPLEGSVRLAQAAA